MTGWDGLKMDDGLVMDQRKPLGPAALLVWSELPTWRGCGGALNWRVSDALAPVKKEKHYRPPPSKQQAARASIQAARQPGLIARWGWLDCLVWGWLFLLTFDADDADGAWVALCQAEPVSLTLRSLVEVVVSVVGS